MEKGSCSCTIEDSPHQLEPHVGPTGFGPPDPLPGTPKKAPLPERDESLLNIGSRS